MGLIVAQVPYQGRFDSSFLSREGGGHCPLLVPTFPPANSCAGQRGCLRQSLVDGCAAYLFLLPRVCFTAPPAHRMHVVEAAGLYCCRVCTAAACVLYCSTRTPHTECTGGQDVDEVQLLLKEGRMVLFR